MPRTRGTDPIAALAHERLAPSDKGLPARAVGLTVAEFLETRPRLGEFWTPLLVLDAAAMRGNAAVIQDFASAHGLELMPHGKTTMAPELWRLQLDAGATGITLATPGPGAHRSRVRSRVDHAREFAGRARRAALRRR